MALIFIFCGLGGLYAEYATWKISPITVSELASLSPDGGNFRISDGFADFANAVDTTNDTIVPIRSRTAPNAPVSLVLMFPTESASTLKNRRGDFDLEGQVYAADSLPKGKLIFAPRVAILSFDVNRPYGAKLASSIAFASLPILFGIIIIVLNCGIEGRTIRSFFRRNAS